MSGGERVKQKVEMTRAYDLFYVPTIRGFVVDFRFWGTDAIVLLLFLGGGCVEPKVNNWKSLWGRMVFYCGDL